MTIDIFFYNRRVSVDFDLMKFYQTYVKYAIQVNERRDSYATAKVYRLSPHYNLYTVIYIYTSEKEPFRSAMDQSDCAI